MLALQKQYNPLGSEVIFSSRVGGIALEIMSLDGKD